MKRIIQLKWVMPLMMIAIFGYSNASAQIADLTSEMNVWQTAAFTEGIQTGEFTFEFDMIPEKDIIDAVTGLTNVAEATTYSDLSVIVRFSSAGKIDAYNTTGYASNTDLTYTAGSTYSVRVEVNTSNQLYDVFVSENGDPEVEIGKDFGFRKNVINLTGMAVVAGNWGFDPLESAGLHDVKNIVLTEISQNNNPVFDDVNDQIVQEGSMKDVVISAQDPLSAALTLSGVDLPDFITMTDNQDGTGVLSIAPEKDCDGCDLGRYAVTVQASNGTETSSLIVNVKVKEFQETTVVSTISADNNVYKGVLYDPSVPFSWVTNPDMYAGGQMYFGGPNGDGPVAAAAVIPFQIPAIPEGESVGAAQFDVMVTGAIPWGNWVVDLYGLPYRSTSDVVGTDFYGGAYGGDANATPLQERWAAAGGTIGLLSTSQEANVNLAEYINAQIEAGAVEGDYIFIRASVQQTEVAASHEWSRLTFVSGDGAAESVPKLNLQFFPPNEAPVLEAIEDETVNESQNAIVDIAATDAEGDAITFSLSNAPSFVVITDNGDGTASISLDPVNEHIGDHIDVVVNAYDGESTGEQTFSITVTENTAPELAAIGDQSVVEGVALSVPLTATDADGDALSFSLAGAPDFVTLVDNADGTASLEVADVSVVGVSDAVAVTVTDGLADASETITVTIEAPLSVNDQLASATSLYPNPTNLRYVNLQLPTTFDDRVISVSMMSISGQIIHQYDLRSEISGQLHRINLDKTLESGQYILQISNTENTITKRFIVK